MKLARLLGIAALLLCMLCLLTASAEEVEWTYPLTPGDVDEALLVLASPAAPLGEEDVPDNLVTLKSQRTDADGNSIGGGLHLGTSSNLQVQEMLVEALEKLTEDAAKEGVTIYVRAGYRSWQEENRRYQQLSRRGRSSAKPGETDYQTGLAVTLVDENWTSADLTEAFAESAAYVWLQDNCGRYGFIIRNPQGKEDLTGCAWEPWHLRYVGIKPAAYMRRSGMCLEEFVPEYEAYLAEFIAAGGDVESVMEAAKLPEGIVELTVTNPDGDNDFILFHD